MGSNYNQNLEYYRKKSGIVSQIYGSQKQHSIMRGHELPTYTKEELREWLYSQKLFHVLYDNWKRLNYQKMYRPSVDRKDDFIGYTMDNIQLMTFGENNSKTKCLKNIPVQQFTEDGMLIESFLSAKDASLATGINKGNIGLSCKNKRSHAGGFIWRYTNENK